MTKNFNKLKTNLKGLKVSGFRKRLKSTRGKKIIARRRNKSRKLI